MTTPATETESPRKSQHDALQSQLGDLHDQYANIQQNHPSSAVRASAALAGSIVDSKAVKAKASYAAGGSPSVDEHAAMIAAAQGHIAKLSAGLPQQDGDAALLPL
jgi:hypothetical protein